MIVIPIIFADFDCAFASGLRFAYQTTRTRLSAIVAFLAENLAGMRIIQVFHQEPRQAKAFTTLNERHRKANVHEYTVSALFNRTLELFGNVAVAAIVWVGGGSCVAPRDPVWHAVRVHQLHPELFPADQRPHAAVEHPPVVDGGRGSHRPRAGGTT